MEILVYCRFLDQIWLQKTVSWTNIEDFFLIQYFNILQFTKTVVDNMCVLSFLKIKKWLKRHFYECDKK